MLAQKNAPHAKHGAQSRQTHCINFFGLEVVISSKDIIEQSILAAGCVSGFALIIMALAMCAGVI